MALRKRYRSWFTWRVFSYCVLSRPMGGGRSIRPTKRTELDIVEPFRTVLGLAKHNKPSLPRSRGKRRRELHSAKSNVSRCQVTGYSATLAPTRISTSTRRKE